MKDKIKIYDFECTCKACPTQFEFISDNSKRWYFRYRNGYWKLYDVTNDDNWELIIDGRYGDIRDGVMDEDTFLKLLKEVGYNFEIMTRKNDKIKFKNLKNLINLCKDDLIKDEIEVSATLDKEDLTDLKYLLEYCDMLESHLKNETTEEMKIYIKKLQEENKMLQANLYSANQEINELIEAEKKGNSKHIPINGTFHLIE